MDSGELKAFLDQKAAQYQCAEFLESDPVQIPHLFSRKEDIEISGFLTAAIAWGNRKSILASATRMMDLTDRAPHDFVMHAGPAELAKLQTFVHRTFQGTDLQCFTLGLRHLYEAHDGLEGVFTQYAEPHSLQTAISKVGVHFFEIPHPQRSRKHFADPGRGSAAKRINMFLRWMVRPSTGGVDFGLWKGIRPSQLSCPLDVHSGKVARSLGLLQRKQNDARAVSELDSSLRELDPEDPVKYDFALFGLGVFEDFQ